MRKKDKGSFWWIALLILAMIAAIVAGYYLGMEKGLDKADTMISKKDKPPKTEEVVKETSKAKEEVLPPTEEEVQVIRQVTPPPPAEVEENPCKVLEEQVLEFFDYLNTKEYIKKTVKNRDTYNRYDRIIKKLSSQPPVPAGEGLDKEIMIKHIFHFFRVLGRSDIRLIKEIIRNEADTLEMNIEMMYRWIVSGDRCPDSKTTRPSPDISYRYAGYLLNTLGGRACLLRRTTAVRLLVSYYCVLIIHEADRKGLNRFGIDLAPLTGDLIKDISLYPGLRFKEDYIDELTKIRDYYLKKR